MTRKLYGISASRALRAIWGMEEVGVDYEHVPTHYRGDAQTDDYRAVNPNGRIPALQDGELVLFESMAINLYLAKTYGGALYPVEPHDEAKALQWSVWAISEIEPLQMQIVIQRIFTPKEQRDPAVIERAGEMLQRPLGVLDAALADQPYLLGERFTVADLNVAAVMLLLRSIEFDYSAHTHVQRWADACYARPALARAQARA